MGESGISVRSSDVTPTSGQQFRIHGRLVMSGMQAPPNHIVKAQTMRDGMWIPLKGARVSTNERAATGCGSSYRRGGVAISASSAWAKMANAASARCSHFSCIEDSRPLSQANRPQVRRTFAGYCTVGPINALDRPKLRSGAALFRGEVGVRTRSPGSRLNWSHASTVRHIAASTRPGCSGAVEPRVREATAPRAPARARSAAATAG
jgi:hypothetical protein